MGARQDKEQAERGERGPGWRGDKSLSPAWTASAPHHRAHSTEANSISREPNSSPEPQVQTSSPSAQALLGTPSPPRGPSPQPQKSLDPQLPGSPSSAARGPTHLPGIRERPAAEEEERRSEGPPRGGSHAVCDDLRGSWSAGRRAAGLDQEAGFTRGQALGGQGGLLAPPGRACAGLGPDSEDGHPACPWELGAGVGDGGWGAVGFISQRCDCRSPGDTLRAHPHLIPSLSATAWPVSAPGGLGSQHQAGDTRPQRHRLPGRFSGTCAPLPPASRTPSPAEPEANEGVGSPLRPGPCPPQPL